VVLVVAAVLVDSLEAPTRLLAARRTGPPRLAGGWEFPGGKVEPDESVLDALHRELDEELGVAIRIGSELTPAIGAAWPIADDLEMRVWLADITAGTPTATSDHDELRWLGPKQLYDVPWLPADTELVRILAALLQPR
jgi:8-oxo-dGTP diphosphatase